MGIFRQFPYSNFHEMNMDEVIKILLDMQDEWNSVKDAWASYKEYIDHYFDTLDLTEETYAALQRMAASGELADIVDPVIIEWLVDNIVPTRPLVDASLKVRGAAADAKVTGETLAEKVNLPKDDNNKPTYGTPGQILRAKGNTSTEWVNPGTPTPEQVKTAVQEWLDEHPEASTTVEDGSITHEKLNNALKMIINYSYPTIPDMIADTALEAGMCVNALSGYSQNDGQGHMYYIDSVLDRTQAYETLDNGLYAYTIMSDIDIHADNRIFNSDDAVSIIADTALTYSKYTSGAGTTADPYVSTKFVYGDDDNWYLNQTPQQNEDGKWEIRCSAFVKDLIFGVTYENSKYLNSSNRFNEKLCIDRYASLLDTNDRHDTRWLALYAYMHGYAFFPNDDYSNIRPGDVLFYDNGEDSPHTDRFMGANHCAVFAYRINDKYHSVWEVGGLPILQRQADTYFDRNLVMCARFPYNDNGSAEKVNLLQSTLPEINTNNQILARINCKKTLQAYKQYTVVIKLDMGNNSITDFFPSIRDTQGRILSLSYNGATLKPIDDVYVMPFVPVEDIKNDVRIFLGKRISGLTLNEVSLKWVNIFEGLVTNCDQYVPPVAESVNLNISQHVIPDSADLNTYTEPGNYTCLGSGSAATMTNCPLNSAGFRLEVIEINVGKQIQILFSDGPDANIYYRRNNITGNIFGTWRLVTMS